MTNKHPITIVTGCLGSGKTTLLTNLLKNKELQNAKLLVNEFGSIGLDHHLLSEIEENTILLKGGCVCCTKKELLTQTLSDLINESHKSNTYSFERIIIETTGLADPSSIVSTVLSNGFLQQHYYIDCVITTIDSKNGPIHLEQQQESINQIISADRVVLTKLDLVNNANKMELIKNIKNINPTVDIIAEKITNLDAKLLQQGQQTFDLSKMKAINQNKGIESATQSLSISFIQALDWSAFGLWLSMLLHSRGNEILRVKGLLDVGENGPVVLNGVQHTIHPPDHLTKWPDEEQLSHLVFIMRNINPTEILDSLKQFQSFLGSEVQQLEVVEQL
jgi:G3E family GTPase